MSVTPSELFDQIAFSVPGFGLVRDRHLREHEELLPHVLLGDLRDFIGLAFDSPATTGVRPTLDEVRIILGILDLAFAAKHPLLENAIAVSFVEGIEAEPHFSRLERLLGPELRAELARQRDWWNAH